MPIGNDKAQGINYLVNHIVQPAEPAHQAGAIHRQSGVTYLLLLFVIAIMSAGLAATGVIWHHATQRAKEKELLFIGDQFRQAIALYYLRTPGAAKRYPERLEDLLLDKRYPTVQRYLRRIYIDPMTRTTQWGLVKSPGGGIMGVYSLSDKQPIKIASFHGDDVDFERSHTYSGWKFIYVPPPGQ